MAEETIIREEDVHDFLGISTKPTMPVVPVAKLARAVHFRNLVFGGEAHIHLRDLERGLRSFADGNPPLHDLLHSVADQMVWTAGYVPVGSPSVPAEPKPAQPIVPVKGVL